MYPDELFYYLDILLLALQGILVIMGLLCLPTSRNPYNYNNNQDEEEQEDNLHLSSSVSCPEKDAGFISSLLFSWMDELIKYGYKIPLKIIIFGNPMN